MWIKYSALASDTSEKKNAYQRQFGGQTTPSFTLEAALRPLKRVEKCTLFLHIFGGPSMKSGSHFLLKLTLSIHFPSHWECFHVHLVGYTLKATLFSGQFPALNLSENNDWCVWVIMDDRQWCRIGVPKPPFCQKFGYSNRKYLETASEIFWVFCYKKLIKQKFLIYSEKLTWIWFDK